MTPEAAHNVLNTNSPIDCGRFYGKKKEVALGAGLIYENILTPVFSKEKNIFFTAKQAVYVLTHECDIDPDNDRPFNDAVCFCPILPIEAFIRRYHEKWPDEARLNNFLAAVAKRDVGRVIYLPSGPDILQYGALVYLNNIGSTHVSTFKDIQPITALSEYGLRELDSALKHSLLRPKADRLSFSARQY